jgi:hypothetical protein
VKPLEFDDPYATWLQIGLYTATVIKSDSYRRTSRWLFAFLHSWDWLPLLNSRPLWDSLLITLSAGGLLISVSGIVIGWRRLGRKLQKVS